MDILAALQEEESALSRSEKRISALIFSDIDFAVNASITDLAERADVSPPTVTRFCRRLGCQSYSEFKIRLAQTTYVGSRYLQAEANIPIVEDVVNDIITRAQKALHALHETADIHQLESVAKKICKAKMVYAFGSGGNSSQVANEIQNRLFRLGIRVNSSSDHIMQLMMAAAAKQNDVMIVSSISGQNGELIKALEVARDYKVFSVALTRANSPLAKVANVTLPIDLPEGVNILKPTAVRFTFLALVDIIATLVAIHMENEAMETLRRIKHQVLARRDADDSGALGD